MPMKTRLMREGVWTPRPLPMRTRWRLSTAATCPAISPAVRFRSHSQLRGEAEPAVHRAAHLAGDAEGGALVASHGAEWPILRSDRGHRRAILARWGDRAMGGLGIPFVLTLLFGGGLAPVAPLAAIAIGHPHGFDGLAVGHAHQVALGAVNRLCRLRDLGRPTVYPSATSRWRISTGNVVISSSDSTRCL